MTLIEPTEERAAKLAQRTARELAELHATRMGLDAGDFAKFMLVFNVTRDAELRHQDTLRIWRGYCNGPDQSVAIAAYLEGVASTRKMKWRR